MIDESASAVDQVIHPPSAPEVLVEGAAWRIIRQREQYQDLVRGETL